MTNWLQYLSAVSGDDTGRQIAHRVGISESAVSRWKNGSFLPDPRQAVAVARAYDRSPLEALIAAGYLTEQEAGVTLDTPRRLQLHDFTDLELAQEMVRRVAEPGHDVLTTPLDETHPAMKPYQDQ